MGWSPLFLLFAWQYRVWIFSNFSIIGINGLQGFFSAFQKGKCSVFTILPTYPLEENVRWLEITEMMKGKNCHLLMRNLLTRPPLVNLAFCKSMRISIYNTHGSNSMGAKNIPTGVGKSQITYPPPSPKFDGNALDPP